MSNGQCRHGFSYLENQVHLDFAREDLVCHVFCIKLHQICSRHCRNLTHLETFPKVLCHICSALFHLSLVVIVLSPFLGARGKTNPSATIPSTSFKGIACNSCSTKDRIIRPLATYLSLFDAPFPGSPPSAGKLQCELKALLCFWRPDPRR